LFSVWQMRMESLQGITSGAGAARRGYGGDGGCTGDISM